MNPPWTFPFWYKITAPPKLPQGKGIVLSYQGITVFLSLADHRIGISDGEHDYLGPVLTGLENEPWIFYGLANDGSVITLSLNATKAIEVSEGITTYKIDQFDTQVREKDIRVIEHDLSSWIIKRESMFKLQKDTSADYRIRSTAEQESQLVERLRSLEDMLQDYRAGKTYFFEDILGNLRSLIYFKPGAQSYDPLLLRIAAFKRLILPVYVPPMDDETTDPVRPEIRATKPSVYIFGLASFVPTIPNVRMTDFQDFLEKPSILYMEQVISPLDLIDKAANTQSTAHLDQRSPLIIEALRDTPMFGGEDWFKQQILLLAQLVLRVGSYVVNAR